MAQWTLENIGLNEAAKDIFRMDADYGVPELVGSILNILFTILGLVFLGLMVYGGMLWLLSEGEEKKVNKARGFIFHSILGLILVLSAFAITSFVVQQLTQQTIVAPAAP
ncbi:hypothetical protein HYV71_04365 [Candidatus Uhrbacteria bacterium]|nr:hypothetical protein [Candidatus Uhrbacteria bacterium]